MPRKKKYKVRLNNIENLETLMQEVYNDSNFQINEAQRAINEMTTGSMPEDVNDLTSITRERANLLKIKDSSIKIKLDLAKLENEIIKANGSVSEGLESHIGESADATDFKVVRDIIKNGKRDNEKLEIG